MIFLTHTFLLKRKCILKQFLASIMQQIDSVSIVVSSGSVTY